MRYSEVSIDGRYIVNHDSNVFHEFLSGDRFLGNTTMFRTSLILAVLKLSYSVHRSLFDDAMQEISLDTFVVRNKFDKLYKSKVLQEVEWEYGLDCLNDLNNSQVIKDGVDSIYKDYLLKSGVEIICRGIGRMVLKDNVIVLTREDMRQDSNSAMIKISSWIDYQIHTAVSVIVKDILEEQFLACCCF